MVNNMITNHNNSTNTLANNMKLVNTEVIMIEVDGNLGPTTLV